MKNYTIGVLLILILVLISFLYKDSTNRRNLLKFPISMHKKNIKLKQPPIHLFLFFSKNNCGDCLDIIRVLNKLPEEFVINGIVPKNEYINEKDIREKTSATFNLVPIESKYNSFIPNYTPTLFGVSPKGEIYFIIGSAPGTADYLEEYLISFYYRTLPLRIK